MFVDSGLSDQKEWKFLCEFATFKLEAVFVGFWKQFRNSFVLFSKIIWILRDKRGLNCRVGD